MAVKEFPPVESANEWGVVAIGGDLEVSTLKLAYKNGIFPWPHEGYPLLWFAPPKRAILEFSEFKISKRLQRYLNSVNFSFRVNGNFAAVIRACASTKRKGQQGTWITKEIIRAYIDFHKAGYAHSFETLNARNQLVGGLYGVMIGKMFCGESMFFREDHASKFAFVETVRHLKEQGLTWMDVQTLTPLVKGLGAKEIERAEFMKKLRRALRL